MEGEIVNRVAKSPLMTIDLSEYMNTQEMVAFDLKDLLFQEMILREKDFRVFVKEHDWIQYTNKNIYVFCSIDAIIPSWAYMVILSKLQPIANQVIVGGKDDLEKALIDQAVEKVKMEDLSDKKIVIKGCGNVSNRDYAYGQITKALVPVVSSLMYGEPCSTVPVYKKPRKK